jgi:serine/threonine protein kinase/Tfp pilus assembly protein PilF
MVLAVKTRLGTYEILGPIGAGGMGEVYRAKDLRLGREVAVKVLPSEVAASPTRLARFDREARAVAGLNHPNIVTLYSVEEEEGIHFLTMELVDGQTLSSMVVPGGLPFPQLLDLTAPLADALVAAHERGVIHRDLKPGNVMVTREGRVKVLDFGLAKMASDEGQTWTETSTTLTETSISGEAHILGTLPYMSPEQIRGGAVDARSDLFALGIILHELATGQRPFAGDSAPDLASSILRDTPAPLSEVRSDVPADLEQVVSQCLEKSPQERPQSARDVSSALRRLLRALERGETVAPATKKVASIAVLPFVNRSPNADDEYFSDGLADELLGVLSRIDGLRVSARASSFQFKGKMVPIGDIGAALKVETLLDGSVRKSGNRVRISVQLVKVSDGYHLWSGTYDRTLEDIFAVQDDIAQSVVRELRSALLGEPTTAGDGSLVADVAAAARGRSMIAEAHRLYLQGRHLAGQGSRHQIQTGIEWVERAVVLDPDYALAWAWLARAYMSETGAGRMPREGFEWARQAAERALRLEPDLAEGHAALGLVRMKVDWDFIGAEVSCRRALALAPGNAEVVRSAGTMARNIGRYAEAVDLHEQATALDPLSATSYLSLGLTYFTAGRLEDAEEAFRKVLEFAPGRLVAHSHLAMVLLHQGRVEEGLAEAEQEAEEHVRLLAFIVIYWALGRRTDSDRFLRQLIDTFSEVCAYQVAEAFAARGEADPAFEWLERAYSRRDEGLPDIKHTPLFQPIHNDPRWEAFLVKLGLAGEAAKTTSG